MKGQAPERVRCRGGRFGACVAMLLILAGLGTPACRTGRRYLAGDTDPRARGTLSGTVRGPEQSPPAIGRRVAAIEVQGGRRFSTRTGVNGGFTLLLPPGRYRLEVALASAENLVVEPEVVELEPGGVVAGVDVVLGGAGLAGGGEPTE